MSVIYKQKILDCTCIRQYLKFRYYANTLVTMQIFKRINFYPHKFLFIGFINKYLFYRPYVTMPNVSLNLVQNTTYYLHQRF